MDYGQTFFPFLLWMICGTNHALLDTLLQDNVADDVFSHHFSTAESQLTSCDFESLCHWALSNHSSQDDWQTASPQRLRMAIHTAGARWPAVDHSPGNAQGHFLLLSSSPSAENSGSCDHHLTSPVLPGSRELCSLQLAVFRSGPALGNLTLLVQRADSSGAPLVSTVIQQRHTRGRAAWAVVDAAIGQVDEPFHVTLLYSSCLDSTGATLALDSLEFIECEMEPHGLDLGSHCQGGFHCDMGGCIDQSRVCDFHTDCPLGEDEGYCDGLPSGSYCSFEQDACGWSVSNQHTAWRRVTGQQMMETEEDRLGDVLRRTPGHFVVLRVQEEGSSQGTSVHSPSLPAPVSTNACQLRFSLYMSADFSGILAVSVEENGTVPAHAPMPVEGCCSWADDWQTVTLDLRGLRRQFSIKISATWGPGSAPAVLALDDITLGACFHADPLEYSDDLFGPLQEPSPSEVSLMTWWFTSCGASGPRGPTQAQCDSAYRNTNVSITVGKEGSVKGVQIWRVPATNRYMISAYGAAGGKGAKNHNKRSHGVFISAIFPLEKGELLYILVGHQGEDACPGRNPLTQTICLGESSVIEDPDLRDDGAAEWAGGGGGGGGATYVFKVTAGRNPFKSTHTHTWLEWLCTADIVVAPCRRG